MKKIGLLCLALVLALGTMGAGLAYWTETLTIGGSVATGNLDAEFSSSTFNPDAEIEATCIIDPPQHATITVDNMYPGGSTTCTLTVDNTGSIPMKIDSVGIVIPSDYETYIQVSETHTMAVIPSLGSGTVSVKISMLDSVTDGEGNSYTFDVKVNIVQFNAS